MALRRLADKLEIQFTKPILTKEFRESELSMKSNVMVITALKSNTIFNVLKKMYDLVNFARGDFLTITQGSHEVTILVSQKYKNSFLKELKNETIIKNEEETAAISLKYSEVFVRKPGLIFALVRELAWRSINIIELASTMTEIIFIVNKTDSVFAYKTLQELIESK